MAARPGKTAAVFGLLLAGATSCSAPPSVVYRDLPDDGLVALLYLDQAARLVSASGLTRSTSPLEIEVDAPTSDARRVLLVGFDAELIAGFTEIGAEALASARLNLAEPGESALPEPAFWARAELGGEAVELTTAAASERFPLRLTASWLPQCDRSLEDYESALLRLSCASEACDASVELIGCNLQIDTNRCTPSLIRARVGTGRGVLEAPTVDGSLSQCANTTPRPGALYSLDCGGNGAPCLVDVVAPGSPLDPPIVHQVSQPLLDVVPIESKPNSEEIHGYLSGIAHSGEHLLVSSFDGRLDDRRCASAPSTRLFVLRDDTLDVVATATAPACLTTILGDPVNGGFIGVVGNPARRIVRIDHEGQIVDARPLPPEITAPLVATAALFDEAPFARGEPPLAVFTFGPSSRRARAYLVAFDARTLAVRQVFTSEEERVERTQDYVSVIKGGKYHEYIVLDRQHEEIWSFIIDDPEEPALFPLSICGQSGTPVELAPSQDVTTLFLSFEDGRGAVGFFGLRGDTFCSRIAPFEVPADPTSIRNWQGSRLKHLVGLRRTAPIGDSRAYLSFFDSGLPGFEPGALLVGYGDVGPFIEAAGGAVFATLPWTAQVLRVQPAP